MAVSSLALHVQGFTFNAASLYDAQFLTIRMENRTAEVLHTALQLVEALGKPENNLCYCHTEVQCRHKTKGTLAVRRNGFSTSCNHLTEVHLSAWRLLAGTTARIISQCRSRTR